MRCGRGPRQDFATQAARPLRLWRMPPRMIRTSRLLTLATAREGNPMIEFVRRQWRPLLLGLIVLLIVLPGVMLAMAGAR